MNRQSAFIRRTITILQRSDTQTLILLATLAAVLVHLLLALTLLADATISYFLDMGMAGAVVVLLALHRYHLTRHASLWLVAALWSYITIGSLLLGGMLNPLLEAYIAIVLIVGINYGERATVFAIIASIVSSLIILAAETLALLPTPLVDLSPIYLWLGTIANIIMIALLLLISLRQLRQSAARSVAANEALTQERNTLRTLIDTLPDAVYIKDTESRFTTANRQVAQLVQADSPDDLIGKTDLELFPEMGSVYFSDEQLLFETGKAIINKEERMHTADGTTAWFLTSKVPLRNAQDEIVGLVGVGRDITAMREAQEALRQGERQAREFQRQLVILHEVTIELSNIDTVDELFRQAIILGRERLGFDRLGIMLIDNESQSIIGTFGTDPDGHIRDERDFIYPISDAPYMTQLVEQKLRSKYWLDTDIMEYWQPIARGWRAMATLWDGDSSIGWLATDNLIKQEAFSENQMELLTLYGATLGHLVTRKQAESNLARSQRQLQARTESLQALYKITESVHQTKDVQAIAQQALEAFAKYIEIAVGSVYLLDTETEHLALLASINIADEIRQSQQIQRIDDSLAGYTVSRKIVTISNHLADDERIHPTMREMYSTMAIECVVSIPIMVGETVLGTINLGFADKTLPNDIAEHGTFISIGNTLGLAVSNARSVSEISRARELSDSIIASIPDIFFMFNDAGEILRWNENVEYVTGYSADYLQSRHLLDLFNKDDTKRLAKTIEATLAEGEANSQARLKTASGQFIPYILTTRRYTMEGTRAIIATGIDIRERNELLQRLEYRATQLQVAGQVSKSIVAVLSPEDLLDYTVNLVCSQFDYYYVGIFLMDKHQEYAVLRAGSGDEGKKMVNVGHRLRIGGQSMIGRCVSETKPFIASNIAQVSEHYANPDLPDTRSEMALPLVHRGVCLGAMTVQSTAQDAFSQEDISIIQFIADHLASALANARLYDIIMRRQRYLGTLRRVSQRATPELELDVFLELVVNALKDEFGYSIVGIMLGDNEAREMQIGAMVTHTPLAADFDLKTFRQPYDIGILGWVMRYCSPYLTNDTANDSLYQPMLDGVQSGSVLAVPIQHYSECIGALVVTAYDVDSLDELDLEMLSEFANELAINIQNLRLYAATRESAAILEQRVNERTSQLSAVNKELEAFAYSVSHDLRAPLRSIDGFSQALLEDYEAEIDEFGQDFLHRIRAASQRMGQLIDDMLTLSRVTRRELVRETIDLSDIAHIVVGIIRQTYPRDTPITIDIQEDVMAHADPRLLQIVLENLMGNAWKFTGKQAETHIAFGSEIQDEQVVYFVRDNGVGFDMTYADKLFGAFQRLHSTSEFEGTGVGLATVQRIITRHGGKVWAESTEGEGATFYFTLGD